jgi:hypothetical protein
MEPLKLSAILLNWKRPFHIPVIVESLRQQPEIDEVLLWNNGDALTLEVENCCDRTINSPENECVLGRVLAARYATNETLFFQDDDLIVHNIPELVETFLDTGRIAANMPDDRSSKHWTMHQLRRNPWVELGFGSVVAKDRALSVLDWPYDRELLRRKADKVMTVLNPFTPVYAGGGRIERLMHNGKESGRDENALYLRPDHKALTAEAVRLTQEWMATT